MASNVLEFDLHFEEELRRYDNALSYYCECLDLSRHSLDDFDLAVRDYVKARRRFFDYVRSLVY